MIYYRGSDLLSVVSLVPQGPLGVQIRAPRPSFVSSEQEQTYTNSHPLVEDSPAEDLLAVGGANLGRFGAR